MELLRNSRGCKLVHWVFWKIEKTTKTIRMYSISSRAKHCFSAALLKTQPDKKLQLHSCKRGLQKNDTTTNIFFFILVPKTQTTTLKPNMFIWKKKSWDTKYANLAFSLCIVHAFIFLCIIYQYEENEPYFFKHKSCVVNKQSLSVSKSAYSIHNDWQMFMYIYEKI